MAANLVDAKDAIRLALALGPSRVDEAVIRDVLGDRSVPSLSQVAQAFGMAAATVRHTWRRDGMPGDAKAKKFVLADILIWWLQRKAANAEARGADEFTKRKREAETLVAEFEAQIKGTKARHVQGEYVPLVSVQQVLRGMLNVVRDAFLTIPRKWNPRFPVKYASEWTVELENDIRAVLTIIAEKPTDDFLEGTSDAEETD